MSLAKVIIALFGSGILQSKRLVCKYYGTVGGLQRDCTVNRIKYDTYFPQIASSITLLLSHIPEVSRSVNLHSTVHVAK